MCFLRSCQSQHQCAFCACVPLLTPLFLPPSHSPWPLTPLRSLLTVLYSQVNHAMKIHDQLDEATEELNTLKGIQPPPPTSKVMQDKVTGVSEGWCLGGPVDVGARLAEGDGVSPCMCACLLCAGHTNLACEAPTDLNRWCLRPLCVSTCLLVRVYIRSVRTTAGISKQLQAGAAGVTSNVTSKLAGFGWGGKGGKKEKVDEPSGNATEMTSQSADGTPGVTTRRRAAAGAVSM